MFQLGLFLGGFGIVGMFFVRTNNVSLVRATHMAQSCTNKQNRYRFACSLSLLCDSLMLLCCC